MRPLLNLDSQIKYTLQKEANKLKEDDGLYCDIRKQIYIREEEREMKKKKIYKRGILVGLATVLLTTGTVFAARVSGWDMTFLKSYHEQPPTREQIKDESGFSPKFVNELPGGYTFMMASTTRGELIDEHSKVKDKGIEFILRYYAPGDNERLAITFFATNIMDDVDSWAFFRPTVMEEAGITFKFVDGKIKYVPKGYQMTQEEQKQMDERKVYIEETDNEYNLGIGTAENQMLAWIDDGVAYSLFTGDGYRFTQEQLINMAKVIINSEE